MEAVTAIAETCIQLLTEGLAVPTQMYQQQQQQQSAVTHKYNDAQIDVAKHQYGNPSVEGEGSVMLDYLAGVKDDTPASAIVGGDGEEAVLTNLGAQEEEEQIAGRRRKADDEGEVQRYPAILRANHQIYNEASTLLYSHLVMEVRPGDFMVADPWDGVMCLGGGAWGSSIVPQVGIESPVEGSVQMVSPRLVGTMEQHVFAKFEKISVVADLSFIDMGEGGAQFWPTFFVDDNFRTSRDDEELFVARLKGEGSERPPVSNLVQHFVDVLVQSAYVSQLDITLKFRVDAAFDIDSEEEEDDDDDDDGPEGEDLECSRQQDEKEAKKMNIANERATELVLEAGVLDPLKRLSNVKRLGIFFASPQCSEKSSKMKPKLSGIIRDLKEAVEGNFVAKQGTA